MINLSALLNLFQQKGALRAFLSWPKFSITSFKMISSLRGQGILPRTVVDAGANVGQFAVACAKIFPDAKIYSFEPNPVCVNKLQKNVGLLGNVTVYPLALGDIEGEVSFNVNSHSHSSSILHLAEHHVGAFPDAREVSTIRVKLSTLDKVLDSVNLSSPVLLKLDVQGYEAQALRGAVKTLKRVDYVILEASFKPMYEEEMLFIEIVKMMETFGFKFLRPVGFLTHPVTMEIIQMDALFCKEKI